MKKYKELYPNTILTGTGLISQLSQLPNVPWSDLDPVPLERMYGVRSSFKTVIDSFEDVPEANRAEVLLSMFGEKWNKLWNIYKLEYNPLSAYKVVETGNNVVEKQSADQHNYGKTQSENSTDTGTVNDTTEASSNSNVGLYGFNSQSSVNSDTSVATSNDDSTETRNLQTTRSVTDGGADTIDREETSQSEHNITKEGNIGYSTPQKLLREEFDLWVIPFFQKVFQDIDNFITIQVW